MNEHKPPGLTWESWAERQIEEGRRAGLFDGLDGEGKPIDGLDGPHERNWLDGHRLECRRLKCLWKRCGHPEQGRPDRSRAP